MTARHAASPMPSNVRGADRGGVSSSTNGIRNLDGQPQRHLKSPSSTYPQEPCLIRGAESPKRKDYNVPHIYIFKGDSMPKGAPKKKLFRHHVHCSHCGAPHPLTKKMITAGPPYKFLCRNCGKKTTARSE